MWIVVQKQSFVAGVAVVWFWIHILLVVSVVSVILVGPSFFSLYKMVYSSLLCCVSEPSSKPVTKMGENRSWRLKKSNLFTEKEYNSTNITVSYQFIKKKTTAFIWSSGERESLPERERGCRMREIYRAEHIGPRCSSCSCWPTIQHPKNTVKKKRGHLVPSWRSRHMCLKGMLKLYDFRQLPWVVPFCRELQSLHQW